MSCCPSAFNEKSEPASVLDPACHMGTCNCLGPSDPVDIISRGNLPHIASKLLLQIHSYDGSKCEDD